MTPLDHESGLPAMHPLLQQMLAEMSCTLLDESSFDDWASRDGRALVFFSEDPLQYRETLDLAVVVPQLARAFAGRFRTGLLLAGPARRLAPRYGFRRWPALVMLDAGRHVGAIDGVRDWSEYRRLLQDLLVAPVSRPPGIGIAVHPAGGPSPREC